MAKTYQYQPRSTRIQNQQIMAMRWLASQGLTAEEIRTFRWLRNVDQIKRVIVVDRPVWSYIYNEEQGIICKKVETKRVLLSPAGSGTEWFFFKSKTPSLFWVFLKYLPKKGVWRAEHQLDLLFSVDEVENFIKTVAKIPEKVSTNLLTSDSKFATMKVAKLNFTNLENLEQT